MPTEAFLLSQNTSELDEADLVGDQVSKTRGQLLAEGFSRNVVRELSQVSSNPNDQSTMQSIK